MSNVVIRKVENAQDYRLFFEFPWHHYKNDPHWIPPLLSQRRDLLDKKKNPAWEYMEGDYFIALKNGEIVGTIVGFINHHHNDHNKEHIGWFGMYETINDPDVSNALLKTACDYVQSRGYDAIRGPQNFTSHEETGLLVENFSPPQVLMPYNPPYYQTLLEQADFVGVMDVYSVYQDRDIIRRNNTLERFGKIAQRAIEKSGITIRPLDIKRKKQEFEIFKEIYNSAWNDNWGFHPFTPRELDALVASLGQFVDPKLAFFAEANGKPAGFALAIPNLNESLQFAYPRPGIPEIWSLLKVFYHWQIAKKIKSTRLPLMGVIPEHRNKGADLALMHALLAAMLPMQYDYMDAGWILKINPLMSIIGKVEGKPYKTHRFYEKSLKPKA
jgi:GNAT superfamily N-acetyltransferase